MFQWNNSENTLSLNNIEHILDARTVVLTFVETPLANIYLQKKNLP